MNSNLQKIWRLYDIISVILNFIFWRRKISIGHLLQVATSMYKWLMKICIFRGTQKFFSNYKYLIHITKNEVFCRFVTSVPKKKYTKHSSNTQMHLVYFFPERTLMDHSGPSILWWPFIQDQVGPCQISPWTSFLLASFGLMVCCLVQFDLFWSSSRRI